MGAQQAVGVLCWSCLRNLENRVRRWGRGTGRGAGRDNLAVKQERTNKKQHNPKKDLKRLVGERGHQIDKLARIWTL